MHCEGKLKLRSHNISYCLIEVVTKAGLTVHVYVIARTTQTYFWCHDITEILSKVAINTITMTPTFDEIVLMSGWTRPIRSVGFI
jgi:hypothetical protein